MFSGVRKSEYSNINCESCPGFISFNDEPNAEKKNDCDKSNGFKRVEPEDSSATCRYLESRSKNKKMHLSIETTIDNSSGSDPQLFDSWAKHNASALLISNPIYIIESLYTDCKFEIDSTTADEPLSAIYRANLKVANKTFMGVGHSKKSAKLEAAKAAVSNLFNLEYNDSRVLERRQNQSVNLHNQNNQSEMGPCLSLKSNIDSMHTLNEDFAENIGRTIMKAQAAIFDTLKDKNNWSVLAGIILTSTYNPFWSNLVAMATGNKCIHGGYISLFGASINDSHAEILSRRCFLVYLYEQITLHIQNERSGASTLNNSDDIIIERCSNRPGYRLKPHIKVHMFVSNNPCGDARVSYPSHEDVKSESCGLLRYKSELDEDTIPIKNEIPSSWDAIIHGEQKFRVMSCSDKLALWNIIGLQGSLLSNFLEPIYLESLTIGSLVDLRNTYRAIAGRMNFVYDSQSLEQLPRSHRLNIPKLGVCKMPSSRTRISEGKYSPLYSINHIKDKQPEVVCTTTGKNFNGSPSRLSKMEMLKRFICLIELQPSLHQNSLLIEQDGSISCPKIYRQAKTASKSYQSAKNKAFNAYIEQNLGKWLSAPCEVDLFKTV